MQQQGIAKGDVLQRLASASFIVGAVLLIVFNVLAPRASDPDNVAEQVRKVADAGTFWNVDHLLLAVGIWAMMIGAVGVYRSINTGSAAVWARLGFYGVIVGTALFSVTLAVGGFGLSAVAEEWAEATGANKNTLLLAATSIVRVVLGLLTMTILVYWLALAFLGVGMALSKVYPMAFGGAIIILGVATFAAVGVVQALAGPSQAITTVVFGILSVLSSLWALALGLWMARKAW